MGTTRVRRDSGVRRHRLPVLATTVWVGLLTLVLLGSALPAAAATPTVRARPTLLAPGAALTVTGAGLPRGVWIALRIDGVRWAVTRTTSTGTFRVRKASPASLRDGRHVLAVRVYRRTVASTVFRTIRPKPTPKPTPTPTPTPAPTPSASALPTLEPTPAPTLGPDPTPAPTPTAAPSASPTPTPAPTPTPSAAPTPTPSPATGAVFYVSPSGSDTGDGSITQPWRTPARAMSTVVAGSTIYLRGGTYGPFSITRSGAAGSPISFRGFPGETATVAGDSAHDNVITVSGVHDIVLGDLVVSGAQVQYGAGVRIDRGATRITVERSTLRDNRSFGIKLADATHVTVRGNDIGHNETGIEISRLGEGILIADNEIHENDRMVTSSRGGNAIVFHLTTGAIRVTGNRIWGNRAPHLADSGYDGGAFEVYGASNLLISGNLLWDNNNAMETGTDGVAPCAGNRFERNTVRGLGTVAGETTGLILRCAEGMLVAHNTFDGLDHYAFYVALTGGYAGSVDGLRILNNIVIRGRAYSLGAGLPADLVIDHDVVLPGSTSATYGSRVAYVEGHGNTDTLAEFRAWTGYEANGIQADPAFVDPASGDYRLRPGSPAVDRGLDLGATYAGAAPDAGRYELEP